MSTHRFDDAVVQDYLEATHAVGEHLLGVLDAACRAAGVPYYVTSGTLLGAVRSGGWIPWDDDVDVIMFRDDYARLVPVVADLLPEDVVFSSPETRADHITVIPRLAYLRSHRVHVGRMRSRVPVETLHVPLDIFVLDRAPRSRVLRRAWSRVAEGLEAMAVARYTTLRDVVTEDSIGTRRRAVELLAVVLAMVLPRRAWHDLRTSWVRLPARLGGSGPFVATNYSTVRGRKMTFEHEWYEPSSTVDFCGTAYPAPGDTDAVLTELYGSSYLVPPEASERQPIHLRGGLRAELGDRSWTIEPEAPPAATDDPRSDAELSSGLAEVHVLVRRLLAELDRVATEIDLPYVLAYGTLLGAARGGDLIPWDVDADVWVHHDHADRLVRELAPRLGPGFELLTAETHPDYEYLFPRLVIRGIHHVHVRVDLFPLDPAPRSPWARRLYPRVMHTLDRVHFVKRADPGVRLHYSPRKALAARLLRVAAMPLPAGVLQQTFRRLQARGSRAVLVNSCGSYGQRELVDAAWFAATSRMDVADLSLPVPSGHAPLLTQLYGDYMTPVPPAQQRRELEDATASFVEPLRTAGHLPPLQPPTVGPTS